MKLFTLNRLLLLLSYLIIGLLVVGFFSVAMGINPKGFMNSDTLYMPTIYRDLFVESNGLRGWNFNSAPNFFPEMIVYIIVRFFSGDFLTANVAYGVVQVWMMMALVNLIFKQLVPEKHILISTISNLLFSICFLMVHFTRVIDIPFYLTTTAYHTGAFVLQLAAMLLILKLWSSYEKKYAQLLFVISLLGVISDKLFIFYFSLPALIFALIYFLKKEKKLAYKFAFLNLAPVVLGVVIFKLIKSSRYIRFTSPHKSIGLQSSLDSLVMMKRQFIDYMVAMDMRTTFILLALFSFALIILILVKDRKKPFLNPLLKAYFLFLVCNAGLVTIVPIAAGNYIGYDTLRYNVTVLYYLLFALPLVLYILIGAKLKGRKVISYLLPIGSLYLAVLAVTNIDKEGLNGYLNYYPDNVRKMDEVARKEGLSMGVGGYWSSHYISMLSRENIKVFAAFPNLNPHFHGVNTSLYFRDDALFDFVILDRFLDQDSYDTWLNSKGELLPYEGTKVIKYPKFRYDSETWKPYFINK